MKERRNIIPNYYEVFLHENKGNNGMMKDDPVNFRQA